MCIFGGAPTAPAPQPLPPPAATEADTSVIEARRRARVSAGPQRMGTLLTGPAGPPATDVVLGRKTLLGQ